MANREPESMWEVVGDELFLVRPDGHHEPASARQIYSLSRNPSSSLPDLSYSRFPAKLSALLTRTGNALGPNLSFVASLLGEHFPLARIASRESEHLVAGGRWIPLEEGSLGRMVRALSQAGIEDGGVLGLGQYLKFISAAAECEIGIEDRWQGDAAAAAALASSTAANERRLSVALYPYQAQGVQWLSSIANEGLGCILGDEMGLGKTIQVIALLAGEKASGRCPNLVVCPATLLENWARELQRFCPTLTYGIHQGPRRTGYSAAFHTVDVVITSYDTVVRDQILMSQVRWNCVVLDEAQAIKNAEAQRSVAIKELPRRVSIAVTGTPVENRLEDLWSIMDFALPGMLGTKAQFVETFPNTIGDAQRLGPVVSPVLLRRRVLDVAQDLPARIDIPQPMRLTPEQAEAYELLRLEAETAYGSGGGLMSLGRLRMFCCAPTSVGVPTFRLEELPKFQRLVEIVEEIVAANEKALIFSSFHDVSDRLVAELPQRFERLHAGRIDGRVAVSERQPIIDRFTEVTGPGVLILSPRAAGLGLNIVAANHVIHYNPEWNPAIEDQASARAYRRGQTRPVTIHRLFYVGTVEEVMVERLEMKRHLAAGAVPSTVEEANVADLVRALRQSPVHVTA